MKLVFACVGHSVAASEWAKLYILSTHDYSTVGSTPDDYYTIHQRVLINHTRVLSIMFITLIFALPHVFLLMRQEDSVHVVVKRTGICHVEQALPTIALSLGMRARKSY